MREIASLETVFSVCVCVCFHSPTCTSPRLSKWKPLHNALQGRHRCILGSSSPKMIVIGLMACKQARGCFFFFFFSTPESEWEMQPVLSPALTQFSAPTASVLPLHLHRMCSGTVVCFGDQRSASAKSSTHNSVIIYVKMHFMSLLNVSWFACTDSWTDLK